MRKSTTWDPLADKETGALDRPYPKTAIAVPRQIRLDPNWVPGGALRWSPRRGWGYCVPSFQTLAEFLELAEAKAETVLSFAKRWGLLMLCEHDMPASHDLLSPTGRTLGCDPQRNGLSGGWERISLWQGYAREASAIMHAALALGEGKSTLDRSDAVLVWSGFLAAAEVLRYPDTHVDGGVSWEAVGWAVNRWLAMGTVRPTLFPRDYPPTGLGVLYGGSDYGGLHPECRLFGALAIQLMQSVSGDVVPGHCPCGRFFRRERSNQRYCDTCGKKGRARMASRRYYDRARRREVTE